MWESYKEKPGNDYHKGLDTIRSGGIQDERQLSLALEGGYKNIHFIGVVYTVHIFICF